MHQKFSRRPDPRSDTDKECYAIEESGKFGSEAVVDLEAIEN